MIRIVSSIEHVLKTVAVSYAVCIWIKVKLSVSLLFKSTLTLYSIKGKDEAHPRNVRLQSLRHSSPSESSSNAMEHLQNTQAKVQDYTQRAFLPDSRQAPFASLSSLFIPPRHFNHVEVQHISSAPVVLKSSSDPSLRAELYFYQNIPAELLPFFPKLLGHYETHESNRNILTIILEYIPATNMSHILTSGRLTKEHIHNILQTLHKMHFAGSGIILNESVLKYNYIPKLCERYIKSKSLYFSHGVTRADIDLLCSYLREHKPLRSHVIHGDPVFTNILFNGVDRSVIFLDMRGAQGKLHTTSGDVYYDLAKVLQSLCAYDHILTNVPYEFTYHFLLLNSFFDEVSMLYPGVSRWNVVLVTASLFISLMPLHEDVRARSMYALIGQKLLRWLHSWRGQIVAEGAFSDLAELTQEVLQYRLFPSTLTTTMPNVTALNGLCDPPVSLLETAESVRTKRQ